MPKSRDKIDALLTDLLDEAEVSESSHELISAEPELRNALEDARAGQALLQQLTPRPTPAHFERRVQQRVRRRSGGRYFSHMPTPFGFGVTIDAFVVLAVAIMAACWFMTQMPAPSTTFYSDPPNIESHDIPGQSP